MEWLSAVFKHLFFFFFSICRYYISRASWNLWSGLKKNKTLKDCEFCSYWNVKQVVMPSNELQVDGTSLEYRDCGLQVTQSVEMTIEFTFRIYFKYRPDFLLNESFSQVIYPYWYIMLLKIKPNLWGFFLALQCTWMKGVKNKNWIWDSDFNRSFNCVDLTTGSSVIKFIGKWFSHF